MNAPESPWGTTATPYLDAVAEGQRRSWTRWILAALGVVVLGAAVAGTYWYKHRPVPLPVAVSFTADPLVPGSVTDLAVAVTNGSPTDTARDVELAITLPEKTTSAGLSNETASSSIAVPTVSLGDLEPAAVQVVHLSLSTELDPSSAVPVSATVSYGTDRDRAKRFETAGQGELVVREPAVTVAVEAPSAVVRAAPFAVTVKYRNNTDATIAGGMLTLALPRGLTIASSTPMLTDGKLAIPSLAARQGGSLALSLIPGPTAPHEMPVRAEFAAGGKSLAERTANVVVSSDALGVSVLANGREEASVDKDQTISYAIEVTNLSRVPLKDVVVQAKLQSPYLLASTVIAQDGSLAPDQPVITWNGVGVQGLRDIEPGAEVRIEFSVRFAKQVSAANVSAPVLVSAASPTVPAGTSASGVTASDTAVAKLAASVAFDAELYARDPLGQVPVTGPQPPQVGKATQYVIRWSVRPDNAGLKDAVVTASLAPGVRFTGKLGGVQAKDLSYDASTGLVSWHPAGFGANVAAQAAFQVEITPAANQKGRTVRLMDDAVLQATDAWTGERVRLNAAALATNQAVANGATVNGVVQ